MSARRHHRARRIAHDIIDRFPVGTVVEVPGRFSGPAFRATVIARPSRRDEIVVRRVDTGVDYWVGRQRGFHPDTLTAVHEVDA